YHSRKLRKRTHLFYLLKLLQKIREIKLIALELFLKLFYFLLIKLLGEHCRCFFNEALYIALAEYPRSHPIGIERLNGVKLFTDANKLYGLINNCADR